jgi:hypothetical protein
VATSLQKSSKSSVPDPVSLSELWNFGKNANKLLDTLEEFLNRGLQNSSMIVLDRKSTETVQLKKYFEPDGGYGIKLEFSMERDSQAQITVLENFLAHLETPLKSCEIQNAETQTTFKINTGKDILTTAEIVTFIFKDILQRPDDSAFTISADEISPWHEVIDSPTQRPANKIDGAELNDKWMRLRDGYGVVSNAVFAYLMLIQGVGVIGLLATLIFQEPEWSGITMTLGAFNISIPWLGLISVCFIALGYLYVFTNAFWVLPKQAPQSGYVKYPRTLKNGFLLLFGGPLSWIYIGLIVIAFYSWSSW